MKHESRQTKQIENIEVSPGIKRVHIPQTWVQSFSPNFSISYRNGIFCLLLFQLIAAEIKSSTHTHIHGTTYSHNHTHTQTHLFQVHVFHETFSRSLEVRQFCLTNRGEETSSSVNATNSSSSTHTQTVRGFTGNGKRLDYNVRKKSRKK